MPFLCSTNSLLIFVLSARDEGTGRGEGCATLNRLLKYCPHCRLRVRLSQRERMGEETRMSRVCNRSKERFLLPGGEGQDEGERSGLLQAIQFQFRRHSLFETA